MEMGSWESDLSVQQGFKEPGNYATRSYVKRNWIDEAVRKTNYDCTTSKSS